MGEAQTTSPSRLGERSPRIAKNPKTTEDYLPGAVCGPAGGRGLQLDGFRGQPRATGLTRKVERCENLLELRQRLAKALVASCIVSLAIAALRAASFSLW